MTNAQIVGAAALLATVFVFIGGMLLIKRNLSKSDTEKDNQRH